VKIPAAAIAIENRGRNVQADASHNPELPVGKQAADRELLGHADIRRQAPESHHVSHERHGNQQRATGQSQMTVLARRFPERSAWPKLYANDHEMNRPYY
jgi:hypothetical protein